MQFETLQKDMILAMKAHDKTRKEAISILISAAKKIAIDEGCRDNITEEIVNRAVLKEVKSAKEQVDTCPDSRADLREAYQIRLDIMSAYAPQMLSEEDIRKLLTEKYSELLSAGNKGMIMKAVMGELKGKADGKLVTKVVSELVS